MKLTCNAAAVALLLAGSAFAGGSEVADKKALTLEGARKAIAGAVAYAHRNNAGGVIAVVDDGGNLMALERIDGTFAAGANISIGKARTAALFKKPTKFFEDVIGKGRTSMVALNDFTPLQGGVPIEMDGQIVGEVVSAWTGIPVGKMLKDEISAILSLQDHLSGRVKHAIIVARDSAIQHFQPDQRARGRHSRRFCQGCPANEIAFVHLAIALKASFQNIYGFADLVPV